MQECYKENVIYAEFCPFLCLDIKGKLCDSSIIYLEESFRSQTLQVETHTLVFCRRKKYLSIPCIHCHFFGF